MCSTRAGPVGQGWVTARTQSAKGRQCPIHWHSLFTHLAVPKLRSSRALKGFLGLAEVCPP